jgi:hypothetical protein
MIIPHSDLNDRRQVTYEEVSGNFAHCKLSQQFHDCMHFRMKSAALIILAKKLLHG